MNKRTKADRSQKKRDQIPTVPKSQLIELPEGKSLLPDPSLRAKRKYRFGWFNVWRQDILTVGQTERFYSLMELRFGDVDVKKMKLGEIAKKLVRDGVLAELFTIVLKPSIPTKVMMKFRPNWDPFDTATNDDIIQAISDFFLLNQNWLSSLSNMDAIMALFIMIQGNNPGGTSSA